SGIKRSLAPCALRSRAMLRLPLLSRANPALDAPKRGWYPRSSSPVPGRSILITSAPASARIGLASGPGSSVLKSRTLMPASGRMGFSAAEDVGEHEVLERGRLDRALGQQFRLAGDAHRSVRRIVRD